MLRTEAEAPLSGEAAGFVALLDGSDRAMRALTPAREIARWYRRPLTICAVTGGDDDRDTRSAVTLQLLGAEADIADVAFVAKVDLRRRLFESMRRGHILVASAFGTWAADGRLQGAVTRLVSHNAPAVIGVGPNVRPNWKPASDQPLVVFVDASDHALDVVDRIDPLLTAHRCPLVVVHITAESRSDSDISAQVAEQLSRRSGLPVEAKSIVGRAVADAISTISSTLDAQMAIVTSWHRPRSNQRTVASTSVRSIAQATCPVMVLSPR